MKFGGLNPETDERQRFQSLSDSGNSGNMVASSGAMVQVTNSGDSAGARYWEWWQWWQWRSDKAMSAGVVVVLVKRFDLGKSEPWVESRIPYH